MTASAPLVVTRAPPGFARLRFVVDSEDPLSLGTLWETDSQRASHVEAVVSEGIIGAYMQTGVALRPIDYDTTSTSQTFVDIALVDVEKWEAALKSHRGEPYDFLAIAGFVAHRDLHMRGHVICSALQTLVLRDIGFFKKPLTEAAHRVSPRDLLLMLSGMAGDGVIVHPVERREVR